MTKPRNVALGAGWRRRAPRPRGAGFTLLELLVVVGILALLVGLVMPAFSRARAQGKSTVCLSRLRTLGQGLILYANENDDMLVPGRMPKVDDENWRVDIEGGLKYRPTFLAMMGSSVGIAPFSDPQRSKSGIDREGQRGGRQDYASETYLCPEVSDWTDERNGAYGYNYQFLGNGRLRDPQDILSFKNWPIPLSTVRAPGETVVVGDSIGTAAAIPYACRTGYANNARTVEAIGNEGFNLDPPWVDPVDGEVAFSGEWEDGYGDGGTTSGAWPAGPGTSQPARSAVDQRHLKRANVLWLDGHAGAETLESLGYTVDPSGIVGLEGNNRFWSTQGRSRVWKK